MASQNVRELARQVHDNCISRGDTVLSQAESASEHLLLWLGYLKEIEKDNSANCLLEGAASAIREAAACIALGLVRPALNSLRLQIDLFLAWLYFKDHKIEWERVQSKGDGFKLKHEIVKYLTDNFDAFPRRYGVLEAIRKRREKEPYRLLSAHVHGQSEPALPKIESPADVVASISLQDEAIALQKECSEYIGDILYSLYSDNWHALPSNLHPALIARFKTKPQQAEFFE